jgi:hypothetical protein
VSEHACIDCRKSPPPGGRPRKIATADGEPARCLSHLRQFTTRQRQQARGRSVERTYEISAADNGELLVFQDGRCWICGNATGASKSLATDHDHADDWVRGRLCSTCNQFIGRQLKDDPRKALNLVNYLSGDTPYRRMLAARWVKATYGYDLPADRIRVQVTDGGVAVWWNESGQLWNTNYSQTLESLAKYATPKS